MRIPTKPIARSGLLFLVSLVASPIPLIAQSTEGDAWLKMSSETQTGFLRAYTAGVSWGFAQGCNAYYGTARSMGKHHTLKSNPFGQCLSKALQFSRPVDSYVKQLTEFYTSFPADRNVSFERIMEKLSDSEGMTSEQIHTWFKEHGPKG